MYKTGSKPSNRARIKLFVNRKQIAITHFQYFIIFKNYNNLPVVGLEPTRLTAANFESATSTNSVIQALNTPKRNRTFNLLLIKQMLYH